MDIFPGIRLFDSAHKFRTRVICDAFEKIKVQESCGIQRCGSSVAQDPSWQCGALGSALSVRLFEFSVTQNADLAVHSLGGPELMEIFLYADLLLRKTDSWGYANNIDLLLLREGFSYFTERRCSRRSIIQLFITFHTYQTS